MTDKDLIKKSGIHNAIIVDDGYDKTPKVDELIDVAAWDTLFDDASGKNEEALRKTYADFNVEAREELKDDQKFLDALWAARGKLGNIVSELFRDYKQKSEENAKFLGAGETALYELDIRYKTYGRDFIKAAETADLIVIDLYLGTKQGKPESDLTVRNLKEAIEKREGPPPSVVLMSQVGTVADSSKTFRREVGLHASGFRWINKKDLKKPGRVGSLLVTLATHRKDSHALAAFLKTWQVKAKEAVDQAAMDLRRIDIDDLQHTKSLLLNLEGLNMSSYMLDVFDRVLQYEIEADADVLRAASNLNTIGDDPPPLTIATDRDPFRLLERTIFVNPERKSRSTGAVWPITFGDIIAARQDVAIKKHGWFAGREDQVFFVASPECDMIRNDGLKTALLISGKLHPLKMNAPILGHHHHVTPVLSIGGNQRSRVEWEFGNLRTVSLKKVENLLGPDGDGTIVARLRDVSALSLRQKFLNNLGRVGEMASPLISFAFSADIFIPLSNGTLQKIDLPADHTFTGTCLVHRKSEHADLIFDQSNENDFTAALHSIDRAKVAKNSVQYFLKCREQSFVRQLFRTGLQKNKFPLGETPTARLFDLDQMPHEPNETPKLERIGTIVSASDATLALGKKLSSAGVIFHILSIG